MHQEPSAARRAGVARWMLILPVCIIIIVGAVIIWPTASTPPAGNRTPKSDRPPVEEVIVNIRSQVVGNHTVGDYNLPEAFLRGLADRIIRTSFEEKFRTVISHGAPISRPDRKPAGDLKSEAGDTDRNEEVIRVVKIVEPDSVRAYRRSLREERPPLTGYRAPVLDDLDGRWPFDVPNADAPEPLKMAADVVGKRLATDGLLLTLAQVIQLSGPRRFRGDDDTSRQFLREAGLPVDLIDLFRIPESDQTTPAIQWIAARLERGESVESIKPALAHAEFNFRPVLAGFQVSTESGENDIEAVRLQLSRGDYWDGIGDGGNVDLARQLIERLPDAMFVASIQDTHLEDFQHLAATWPREQTSRLTLFPQSRPVAQWAQDNGKAGVVAAGGEHSSLAIIVPRFASQGEDGSIFMPGETFQFDDLSQAGLMIAQSPLLFQGGNLLAVRDPRSGERILLIGEAEIYRNTILGLSAEQVLHAFQIEFGVDRCEVLPAVSFHVDYDFCVRAHGDHLIAFVNETESAIMIIQECAIELMRAKKMLNDGAADTALQQLQTGNWQAYLDGVGRSILGQADHDGHFLLSFADQFSIGPVDSGVGNLQRLLLSLDMMASMALAIDQMPAGQPLREYLESLARGESARQALHQRLSELGFQVVPVPGMVNAARGINAVNGIHARGVYLMPAYGGMYSRLDDIAAAVLRKTLGDDVKIVPVLCGESQRRVGAVHCSASALYRPASGS